MKFINYKDYSFNRALLYIVILLLSYLVVYISTRMDYKLGLLFAMAPIILILFVSMVQNPFVSFLVFFSFIYLVMGLYRYIRIVPPGVAIDFSFALTILIFAINSFYKKSDIKISNSFNTLTFLALVWFLYCMVQFLNPHLSSPLAWLAGVRNIGVYFLITVVIASIILKKEKRIQQFIFVWSILSLLAVIKAMVQKFIGFDAIELTWLYFEGGSSTHILYYGARYFSIFTDAANFGSGIALSAVVFTIYALTSKTRKIKIYYLIVSIICIYGMIISGTRGSLAVPFVGFTLFVFLSKNVRHIVIALIVIGSSFFFLKFTHYGQGNTYIRRMRSAFSVDDPSLKVRQENQQRLRTYMWKYPFGVGIAMSRPGAVNYVPHPVISKIPSDSWYVRIWMEMGIVGLLLHIFILLYIVAYGAYLSLFKLRDPWLRGVVNGMVCGLTGVYFAAYSLELIGQIPNSIIIYICMAIIFISPDIDKNIQSKNRQLQLD